MGEADVIFVSTPIDTSEKLMPNNGQAVSQLKYSRMIGCLIYAITYTRPDITFAVGKLSRARLSLAGWSAISWATKKTNCIIRSIIEYEFVALAAASKEAEWLRNQILEIPLWSKTIAPIFIRYDSAATLASLISLNVDNGSFGHWLSFQMWTNELHDALNDRKRSCTIFQGKDLNVDIDSYMSLWFQMWINKLHDALNGRKRGYTAFRGKDLNAAIDS
ncbi:hypothetical protein Tco_0396819 [Tanacetum coccineum]